MIGGAGANYARGAMSHDSEPASTSAPPWLVGLVFAGLILLSATFLARRAASSEGGPRPPLAPESAATSKPRPSATVVGTRSAEWGAAAGEASSEPMPRRGGDRRADR